MTDDIVNRPDLVRANCQQCDWQSEPIVVDYSKPNGLWFARQAVAQLHGAHSAVRHKQIGPYFTYLMKEARRG